MKKRMRLRKRHAEATDTELISRVAKGSEGAFNEILHRYQGAVYAFALRFLKDPNEAPDIAQETFLRLYRTSAAFRPRASLRAYLFRIARNLCLDYQRKKRPVLMAVTPEKTDPVTPLHQMIRTMEIESVFSAIDGLPDNQRMAILLRHDQELSYTEIAETMNTTVSAVESLLVRARRKLRQLLK